MHLPMGTVGRQLSVKASSIHINCDIYLHTCKCMHSMHDPWYMHTHTNNIRVQLTMDRKIGSLRAYSHGFGHQRSLSRSCWLNIAVLFSGTCTFWKPNTLSISCSHVHVDYSYPGHGKYETSCTVSVQGLGSRNKNSSGQALTKLSFNHVHKRKIVAVSNLIPPPPSSHN